MWSVCGKRILGMGLAILLFVFLSIGAKAEIFSLDPCGESRVSYTANTIIMENNCLLVEFPKKFNPQKVRMFDKLNLDKNGKPHEFKMVMVSIVERDSATKVNRLTKNLFLNSSVSVVSGNRVEIANDFMKVTYEIISNRLKISADVFKPSRQFANTNLWFKYLVRKHGKGRIVFKSPEVDGKLLSVSTESVQENGDDYIYERIGFGSRIVIDPIYVVDYSPVPAEYLVGGNVSQTDDSAFDSRIDITSGVSDNNDSTTYLTEEYHFNGYYNVTQYDGFESGDYTGGTGWSTNWIEDEGGGLDISVSSSLSHNGTYSLRFAGTFGDTVGTIERNFTSHSDSLNLTFWRRMRNMESPEYLEVHLIDASGVDHTIATWDDAYDDDSWHFHSFILDEPTYDLNGELTLYFEVLLDYGNDEVFIDDVRISSILANFDNGTAIVGKWNKTYDPDYHWFLRVRKTSSGDGTFTIYAYSDNESIAQDQFVQETLLGTGWFNINVSSLVDYETNVAGLDYTRLRFFSYDPHYFSEVYLRAEQNDTEAPIIHSCQINDTILTNNEIARLKCNVTDNIDVDFVNGTIEGMNYTFIKEGDWYYYDFECIETNPSIDWTLVEAYDIVGNRNTSNPNISFSCYYDDDPPYIFVDSPEPIVYNTNCVDINVTSNETVDTWFYQLDSDEVVVFTPNITICGLSEGGHNLTIYANDSFDNVGSQLITFITDAKPPTIQIISPLNTTYAGTQVPLEVVADEPIEQWWFTLNDGINHYFTPNATITELHGLVNGTNYLRVFAEDTGGSIGVASVYFTLLKSPTNATLTLYYPPFGKVGSKLLIYAILRDNDENVPNMTVNITIENITATMEWNETTGAYLVYWIPSVAGIHDFDVYAYLHNTSLHSNGTIRVNETDFCITIRLWNNVSMTPDSKYINNFAWIYAVKNLNPTLKRLFGQDKYTCPPDAYTECMWHGKYENGSATICLFDKGNYTLYIVGNNIRWEKVLPSGYVAECSYCEYRAISQRLLYNLGTYFFDGNETIDLYYNPVELYVFGGFFGMALSGLWGIIMLVIGGLAFVFTLKWTGSVKSALAVLILLPTIIYIILHLAL